MLQLPTDCQRCVLDYINSRSDLKSLCLVSKQLKELASEKLYKRIDVRLWSQGNTDWLLRNLLRKNLKYARELVVEDEFITEEMDSTQYGHVALPSLVMHSRFFNTGAIDPAERDSRLEKILDRIPTNALHTFRFLAQRPLAKSTEMKLNAYQKNIRNLQLCLYTDPRIPNQLPAMFWQEDGLKQLDVYINDPPLTSLLLDNIGTFGRNLQVLSLCAAQDGPPKPEISDLIQNHVWKGQKRMLPLKELRLTSLRLTNMYTSLSSIIDFTQLLKLDLAECAGVFPFLSAVINTTPDMELRLTHLALNEFVEGDAMDDLEDERNVCLGKLFKACSGLRSLHIGLTHLDPLPPALREYLKNRGKELKVLSLFSSVDIDAEDFDNICKSCPNLEELAASVHEEFFLAQMGYENLREFIDSIRRLTNLRTLHIRYSEITMLGGLMNEAGESGTYNADNLAMQMQKFANLVFGEFYRNPDFQLEVLIVGHFRPELKDTVAPLVDQMEMDEGVRFLPQFCFARMRQQDLLGRTATTGVPVSRAVLRRTHAYMSILDVDPDMAAWEQWAGRAI